MFDDNSCTFDSQYQQTSKKFQKKSHVVLRGFATQRLCFGYYQVSTLNPFALENRVRRFCRLMTTPTQNHVKFLNFEKYYQNSILCTYVELIYCPNLSPKRLVLIICQTNCVSYQKSI